ncbi:MAG: hypothetical protein M0D54_05255 [Hyphomonadaceae bacterium JAD_PAG50586_4]|nr:MAG: hypothetical protein M0D54_05255 [Hyphomonadaceae bacterium JAD_PAG50586_4]
MRTILTALAALALTACASAPPASPQDAFFANLSTLCGNAYAGRVVTTDAADVSFASQPLVMHVRDCSATEIRVPFNVGDNRSRTWVITRTGEGLRLKHDHRHEDGSEDVLTQYGGDTANSGSTTRQEFPADEHSKQVFRANNIPVSVDNVWAVEVHPGATFAYELRRPNRHFRVEFDLARPVPAPPASWGAN